MGLITDENTCIDKNTFKNMVKRRNNYNGKPIIVYTNIKTKKDWIAIDNFDDMVKRWNAWYNKKKTEPHCVFVGTLSKAPTLQTGNVYESRYLKNWNIRQDTSYYCALNMIQNIWYTLFGTIVSESEIAKIGKTTKKSGTTHSGINKALEYLANKYKKKIAISWKEFSNIGWKGIEDIYKDNDRAIGFHVYYRNEYGHYEAGYFINRTNNMIGIINSLGNKDKQGNYIGYFEKRSFKDMLSYINGISQPSCLIVTKK